MCGIAGFLDSRLATADDILARTVTAMGNTLRSRGPDDAGGWTDASAGVALGHRRLSIIDLTAAGHQPMLSADQRYVISYNGEIYNYPELRRQLQEQGCRFCGASDTEVVIEACAAWGVQAAIQRLNGIFAFALWDRGERTLYLVRDRLGVKPLYWGEQGPLFLFGSQPSALCAHPGWEARINRDAVAGFMRFAYVPAPLSIYEGMNKLLPGQMLTLRWGQRPVLDRYWDVRAVAGKGVRQRQPLSDEDAVNRLDALLRDAVRGQMLSDVPLGAFLSGGIDSSSVVALMQAQSSRRVKTFSIGFDETPYDEARHARAVAEHLSTDHTELYVSPADAMAVIPRLPEIYDEPFADSSQLPTYLVSELARRHVTVSLSGDGGDELFAGYSRYAWSARWWRRIGSVPPGPRRGLSALLKGVPQRTWNNLFALLPQSLRPESPSHRMNVLMEVLQLETPDALYRRQHTLWPNPNDLVPGAREPHGPLWDDSIAADVPNFYERMQLLDTLTYLPDDILTKIDRASMAVSLETRVPLLDHRVVEFAWHLPPQLKVRRKSTKWLLRQVLYRYVPAKLIERPKMGFGVPLDVWLRGPLRDWAEDLLSPQRLRDDGLLHAPTVCERWREFMEGRGAWHYLIWAAVTLQAWLTHQAEVNRLAVSAQRNS